MAFAWLDAAGLSIGRSLRGTGMMRLAILSTLAVAAVAEDTCAAPNARCYGLDFDELPCNETNTVCCNDAAQAAGEPECAEANAYYGGSVFHSPPPPPSIPIVRTNLKFLFTGVRNDNPKEDVSLSASATTTQRNDNHVEDVSLSEIVVYDAVVYDALAVASISGHHNANHPNNEDPSALIDGSTSTKWVDLAVANLKVGALAQLILRLLRARVRSPRSGSAPPISISLVLFCFLGAPAHS